MAQPIDDRIRELRKEIAQIRTLDKLESNARSLPAQRSYATAPCKQAERDHGRAPRPSGVEKAVIVTAPRASRE